MGEGSVVDGIKVLTEAEACELLIRIDERTKKLEEGMDRFEEIYVTHQEFAPVKVIAYGLVTLCMTGIVGAILAMVLK